MIYQNENADNIQKISLQLDERIKTCEFDKTINEITNKQNNIITFLQEE